MKPEEYDKEKHCLLCKGKGEFVWPNQKKAAPCYACQKTGELFFYLKEEVESLRDRLKHTEERFREEVRKLDSWIQKISSCKTCKGNRGLTPGGCPCEECGLVGDRPWGG